MSFWYFDFNGFAFSVGTPKVPKPRGAHDLLRVLAQEECLGKGGISVFSVRRWIDASFQGWNDASVRGAMNMSPVGASRANALWHWLKYSIDRNKTNQLSYLTGSIDVVFRPNMMHKKSSSDSNDPKSFPSEINMAAEPSERKGADASASAMPAAAGPEPGADGRAQGAEDAPPHDPGEHKRGAEGSHLPGEKPDKVFCVELTNQVVLQKLRDFNERIEKLENEVVGVNTKAERKSEEIQGKFDEILKASQQFNVKVDTKIGEVEVSIKGIRDLSTPEALRKSLQPIVDELTNDKLANAVKQCEDKLDKLSEVQKSATLNVLTANDDIEKKLVKLEGDVKGEIGEMKTFDLKVGQYLGDLEQARPREGLTVVQGFMQVYERVAKLESAAAETATPAPQTGATSAPSASSDAVTRGGSAEEPVSAKPSARATGGDGWRDPGELRKLRVDLEELKVEVGGIRVKLGDKCHCLHVTAHESHLDALQNQVDLMGNANKCGCCNFGGTPPNGGSSGGHGGGGFPAGGGLREPGGGAAAALSPGGRCHCHHVTAIERAMRAAAARLEAVEAAGRRAPFIPADAPVYHASSPPGFPQGAQHAHIGTPPESATDLPLTLGPLGGLINGKGLDDKMTGQEGFRFDGNKGGDRWKGKVERYFISKIPALRVILNWAEKSEREITENDLEEAVGDAMTLEQRETLNSQVWGFLSNCLSGEAETMFKRAEMLNGIDAWRRLVRFIDHGRSIRREALRTEVRQLPMRPIKSLEQVTVGIAEFENKIREYVEVGGRQPSSDEMKTDLLAILPEPLRTDLLWRASDPGEFSTFRDFVLGQTAKVLLNRKKLPVHAVNTEDNDENDFDINNINSVQDFIAFFKRFNGNMHNGNNGGNRSGGGGAGGDDKRRADAPPRAVKCPNCGGEHEKSKCKKPIIPVSKRKCFNCDEEGHTSRFCPKKKTGGHGGGQRSVRTVDDEPEREMPIFGISTTDDGGFTPVRRGVKANHKPQPRGATLEDYISPNVFAAIQPEEEKGLGVGAAAPSTKSVKNSRRLEDVISRDSLASLPAHAHAAMGRPGYPGKMPREQREEDRDWECYKAAFRGPEQVHGGETFECFECKPGSKAFKRLFPDVTETVITKMRKDVDERIALLDHQDDYDEELIANTEEPVTIKVSVAVDSGSVANVINPEDLPAGTPTEPNATGNDFVGAGGGAIKCHGTCFTKLQDGEQREVGCNWKMADVTRPLHSVSCIAGPEDGPGQFDVLFNNKKGVVVPPGIVEKILQSVTPITEYPRKGGLYVAEMKMSGFTRQGRQR